MKGLTWGLLLFMASTHGFSQAKYYDRFLRAIEVAQSPETIYAKDGQVIYSTTYVVKGQSITEFYDKKSRTFLGLHADLEVIDIRKLRFHEKDKHLERLLQKYPRSLAMACYWNDVYAGMSPEDVQVVWGKPDAFRYSIREETQVLTYEYPDKRVVFYDGRLHEKAHLSVH